MSKQQFTNDNIELVIRRAYDLSTQAMRAARRGDKSVEMEAINRLDELRNVTALMLGRGEVFGVIDEIMDATLRVPPA